VLFLAIVYELWVGVILFYWKVFYYRKQGIKFIPGLYPILGNLTAFMGTAKKLNNNENPLMEAAKVYFGGDPPTIYGLMY